MCSSNKTEPSKSVPACCSDLAAHHNNDIYFAAVHWGLPLDIKYAMILLSTLTPGRQAPHKHLPSSMEAYRDSHHYVSHQYWISYPFSKRRVLWDLPRNIVRWYFLHLFNKFILNCSFISWWWSSYYYLTSKLSSSSISHQGDNFWYSPKLSSSTAYPMKKIEGQEIFKNHTQDLLAGGRGRKTNKERKPNTDCYQASYWFRQLKCSLAEKLEIILPKGQENWSISLQTLIRTLAKDCS